MIVPVVAASIIASCALVGVSVMVISPVCVVIVPANADTRSPAVPVKSTPVLSRVIDPVVPALIVFNSLTV